MLTREEEQRIMEALRFLEIAKHYSLAGCY